MAENLRVQIVLANYEPYLKTTGEKNGNVWHRVVLGPFESKRNAETIRHRLREKDIMGCKIW